MRTASPPRLAFIAPRYGPGIVGGAETLCRRLAENLTAHGVRVDVLTTCATDHFTWANNHPRSDAIEGGVRVRRFPVGPRDQQIWQELHAAIDRGGRLDYGEQVRWMANSVWSPELLAASDEYDLVVAMPYLFGTSFWQAVANPDRTVLAPCMHDEAHARQPVVLDALSSVRGLMLNAKGERDLIQRLLSSHRGGVADHIPPTQVVGVGFDPHPGPTEDAVRRFIGLFGAERGYILYAGRRESAKGVGTLFDLYREYRKVAARPRPIALMGSGPEPIPDDLSPWVIDFGFVRAEDQLAAYAGADLLIQPSRLESFGMVLFESWLARTPVFVNAESDVLRNHCEDSGGGLWYTDTASFCEGVMLLTEDRQANDQAARRGRDYVLRDYSWDQVRARFMGALTEWVE